jgi:hypothetical protein
MQKTVISREMWYRGQGGEGSCLERYSDGRRCCLGFDGRQNFPDVKISGKALPSSTEYRENSVPFIEKWEKPISAPLTNLCKNILNLTVEKVGFLDHLEDYAAYVNDNKYLPEDIREILITAIFFEADTEAAFID